MTTASAPAVSRSKRNALRCRAASAISSSLPQGRCTLPGFGHLAWQLVSADGNVTMTGFDTALIRDGVITDLYTVLIPPQQ